MDPRYQKLAQNLCRYSMALKKGDRLLVEVADIPDEMTVALIREARKCGALVWVNALRPAVRREIIAGGNAEQFKIAMTWQLARMKKMTAYCAIRGAANMFENSDIPAQQSKLHGKIFSPLQEQRVNHTKWVVLRWPSPSMAQAAKMSTEAFADHYFKVCTLDYSRMLPGSIALEKLMKRTNKVHIKGPGKTDLRFSIKNIGAKKCVGEFNIPDGEVFSAPVKESVEGVIHYNTPTVYDGCAFENIRLEFKKGKIVKATCGSGDVKRLNKIFDSDAGARYVGEFAIGFNPHVKEAICDILFDEKIAGSLHFTPGRCYDECSNGNKSQIHWDLVLIQRPEYGGGEIWFDGKLIRKNGMFVAKGLEKLNPKWLLGRGK
jgi:aminopeptidase